MQIKTDQTRKIFSLLDLTSLNKTDTELTIATLCQKAVTPLGHVAAVCIYPKFVLQASKLFLNSPVKIATVVNFPAGDQSLECVLQEIECAIKNGAHEIDVVFPYKNYLAGKKEFAGEFIKTCKKKCGEKILLKTILETGALQELNIIAEISECAISAGADFLKTSTGKIDTGATLDAAEIMLKIIKQQSKPVGLKVSGGVRTIAQAQSYIELAHQMMGPTWVSPDTFRIGASALVDELLDQS